MNTKNIANARHYGSREQPVKSIRKLSLENSTPITLRFIFLTCRCREATDNFENSLTTSVSSKGTALNSLDTSLMMMALSNEIWPG